MAATPHRPVVVRRLGRRDYVEIWQRMRAFTDARDASTDDELWVLEHDSVFTLGQAGRREHVLAPGGIPVVHSDRGGQVTWHGPGQVVVYTLIDMRRLGIGVRRLVARIEDAVIDVLASHGLVGARRAAAPGVYVGDAKIAALGLRVRNARSYHGVALNVDADLSAFSRIDPCGHRGLAVTRLADLGVALDVARAGDALAHALARRLGLAATGTGTPARDDVRPRP